MTKEKNTQGKTTLTAEKGGTAKTGKEEMEGRRIFVCKVKELYNYWRMAIRYQVKPSTYGCYCTVIQTHILPEIGELPVAELSTERFTGFIYEKQGQGLAGSTIRLIIFLMKSMIKTGEEIGCHTAEPLRYNLPRTKGAVTRLMSGDNFRVLLQRLMRAENNFEMGILISLCTGIRVGELCGLKWGDIDTESGLLQIRRTVSRIQNTDSSVEQKTQLFIGTPKTGTSSRDIPLPDFLLVRLKEKRRSSPCFLLTGAEKCMEPRGVQRRFKNLLKKLGIPDVNIHSLRHSFASNWIENGFDTKALSEILGHSSVKITMDIYVHSSMNRKKEYMNRMLGDMRVI